MKRRKNGKINEIIFEYTSYRSGYYSLYPTISDLYILLEKLIESNSTTEYIRITPFYVNERVNMQIEFEDYMFYLECMEEFDDTQKKEHVLECLGSNSNMDIDKGLILFPLCKYNDIKEFKLSLQKYREFIGDFLPELFEIAKKKMKLEENDLAFGYFCFEVHSG